MGIVTEKRSLPFRSYKKRASNAWIPFAEFEANYLAKLAEGGEQPSENEVSPNGSPLSASRRVMKLISYFPRATTVVPALEARLRIKFDPTRLDKMPEIESGIVQKGVTEMESRFRGHNRMSHVSRILSFDEENRESPYIGEGDMTNCISQRDASSIGSGSTDGQSRQRSWLGSVHNYSNSCSMLSPRSPGQLSCISPAQNDIRHAVQRVCSDALTVSSLNLSSTDLKGSVSTASSMQETAKNFRGVRSQDCARQRLSSPTISVKHSRSSSSESLSKNVFRSRSDRESSASSVSTGHDSARTDLDTLNVLIDKPSREELTSTSNQSSDPEIPEVGKSEEEEMAQRIIRQKKLFNRKKAYKRTISQQGVNPEAVLLDTEDGSFGITRELAE